MTPELALAHRLHRLLHQEEGRLDVDIEQPVEGLRRGVVKPAALGVAGGIHQHVEPPEGLERFGNRARRQVLLAQIPADGFRLAECRQLLLRGGEFGGIAVEQHDPGESVLEKAPGRGRAQPLRPAGDQRHPFSLSHPPPLFQRAP